jgi:hypothetical protein
MSTATRHNQELHERVEALRVTICAAICPLPCVLLALLLGLFNPALCVLHCVLIHPGLHTASAPATSHVHHSHTSDARDAGAGIGSCVAAGLPGHPQYTPRAVYELTSVLLLLVAFALVHAIHTARAPWHPLVSDPRRPLTPPPETLAFI